MALTTVRKKAEETATRELNDNQRSAAELLFLGYSQVHIARSLGFRESTVSEWRRLPEFERYLGALRGDARESFRLVAAGQLQLAVECMNELMLKGPAEVRARIALAVWSRGLPEDGASPSSNVSMIGQALVNALREARS